MLRSLRMMDHNLGHFPIVPSPLQQLSLNQMEVTQLTIKNFTFVDFTTTYERRQQVKPMKSLDSTPTDDNCWTATKVKLSESKRTGYGQLVVMATAAEEDGTTTAQTVRSATAVGTNRGARCYRRSICTSIGRPSILAPFIRSEGGR